MAKKAPKKPARIPTVRDSWTRIEKWIAEHSPRRGKILGKPGALKELRELERKLQVTFPKPFVDSHLIHSGGKKHCEILPNGGWGAYFLLTPKEMLRDWETMEEVKSYGDFDASIAKPDKGVANTWWCANWIPFASNGGGDTFCLDFAPAKGGVAGQVIQVIHDDPKRRLLGKSFSEFLAKAAREVEKGLLDYLGRGDADAADYVP